MKRLLNPRLEMPRLGLPAFRQRILVCGVFVLLPAETHRARITLDMRGSTYRWIAPYEAMPPQGHKGVQGRLTGFVDNGTPRAARA